MSRPRRVIRWLSWAFCSAFTKGRGTFGWSTDENGPEEYTVINVYLDITPVRMPNPIYSTWPGPGRSSPPAAERDGAQ